MININRLNQNNQYNLGNPDIQTKRSELIMRETNQSTGYVGKMIPAFIHEMLPSETIQVAQTAHVQFTPFIKNLMHEMNAEINTYFVPNRIIWKDWEKFITGCDEENDIVDGSLEILMKNIDFFRNITRLKYGAKIKQMYNRLLKLDGRQIQINNKTLTLELNSQVKIINFIDYVQNISYQQSSIYIAELAKLFFKNPQSADLVEMTKAAYYGEFTFLDTDEISYTSLLNYAFSALFEHTIIDYMGIRTNGLFSQHLAVSSQHAMLQIKAIIPEAEWNDKYSKISETAKNTYGSITELPIRAINKVYNDWVRQLDWETKREIDDITVPTANYYNDYFTRARRFAYRGVVPSVPVDTINQKLAVVQDETKPFDIENQVGTWKIQNMMSAAAILNYYLANAKIKPRYSNQLLARWGVNIQDERFQYAHFIHSGEISVTQQGVVQQAPGSAQETQLGDIQGQMWSNGGTQVNFRAPEHGYLISFLVIKPANVYELGIETKYIKKSKFDFATPEMVDLPDMPIYLSEISGTLQQNTVIGYKSMYDEYRTKVNRVTGLLRPSIGDGMHTYTLARNIDIPQANYQDIIMRDIVKCTPDMARIKIYTEEPDFMFFIANQIMSRMPLPYKTDPRIML